jgi:hypothetical protein
MSEAFFGIMRLMHWTLSSTVVREQSARAQGEGLVTAASDKPTATCVAETRAKQAISATCARDYGTNLGSAVFRLDLDADPFEKPGRQNAADTNNDRMILDREAAAAMLDLNVVQTNSLDGRG